MSAALEFMPKKFKRSALDMLCAPDLSPSAVHDLIAAMPPASTNSWGQELMGQMIIECAGEDHWEHAIQRIGLLCAALSDKSILADKILLYASILGLEKILPLIQHVGAQGIVGPQPLLHLVLSNRTPQLANPIAPVLLPHCTPLEIKSLEKTLWTKSAFPLRPSPKQTPLGITPFVPMLTSLFEHLDPRSRQRWMNHPLLATHVPIVQAALLVQHTHPGVPVKPHRM